jgi:hypothetical protein
MGASAARRVNANGATLGISPHTISPQVGPVPYAHVGLGLACYVQVTSPIRRYGDLCVHRQLKALLRGGLAHVPFPQPPTGSADPKAESDIVRLARDDNGAREVCTGREQVGGSGGCTVPFYWWTILLLPTCLALLLPSALSLG